MHQFTVPEADAGMRADVFVARAMDTSRTQAAKLLAGGHVLVNGLQAKPGRLLNAGEVVCVELPPPAAADLQAQPMPLEIVYQDPYLLVINKPRGLVVHPGAGHANGTLVHGLLAHGVRLSAAGDPERPGIVHRLDRDTSGLLLVAAEERTHRALQKQIHEREVRREYAAIVWGDPPFAEATVDAAIGRHPTDRKRMAVLPSTAPGARPAKTDLVVVERFEMMTLLYARLHTGRTHQIRVHCAYAGHPVVGDPVYGSARALARPGHNHLPQGVQDAVAALSGQALHAARLCFVHPVTGQAMEFEAPLPTDMTRLLEALRTTCR